MDARLAVFLLGVVAFAGCTGSEPGPGTGFLVLRIYGTLDEPENTMTGYSCCCDPAYPSIHIDADNRNMTVFSVVRGDMTGMRLLVWSYLRQTQHGEMDCGPGTGFTAYEAPGRVDVALRGRDPIVLHWSEQQDQLLLDGSALVEGQAKVIHVDYREREGGRHLVGDLHLESLGRWSTAGVQAVEPTYGFGVPTETAGYWHGRVQADGTTINSG
jgi:hypothetical protein